MSFLVGYTPEERTCAYLGCIGPLINGALHPGRNCDCADVLPFTNQVGDRSIVFARVRLLVFFRRPILAASCAAFSMVIHSEADGLEPRFRIATTRRMARLLRPQ
jgi:hypothetical protein